jgi:hypothetical protein
MTAIESTAGTTSSREPAVNDQQSCGQEIPAGEEASVENRSDRPLAIEVTSDGGTRITLELAPGQAITVATGEVAMRVVLPDGDVDDVLVVNPSLPS